VIGSIIYHTLVLGLPRAVLMRRIGMLAVAASLACENASSHDPTAKLTQRMDLVRNNEISAGSFSRET
jgi:hypothetical protein